MNRKINTFLFGNQEECRIVAEIMKFTYTLSKYYQQAEYYDDLNQFEAALTNNNPSLLVVLADGEEGMECVCRSKEIRPELPVFWFLDDSKFAIQSYRAECTYFSTKPVTPDKIELAIEHCRQKDIQYSIQDNDKPLKINSKHKKKHIMSKSKDNHKNDHKDIDLKHLGKTQLLELLLVQTQKAEKLQDELEKVTEELSYHKQQLKQSYELTQKILTSHSVMETAQSAVKQYQENIEAMQLQAKNDSEKLLQLLGKTKIDQRDEI